MCSGSDGTYATYGTNADLIGERPVGSVLLAPSSSFLSSSRPLIRHIFEYEY